MPFFPGKPPQAAAIKTGTGDVIYDALVRGVFMREGTGDAEESVGEGVSTLNNGAAWAWNTEIGGHVIDFSAAANSNLNFGPDGLDFGNNNLTAFFAGIATVNAQFHFAGAPVGPSTDSYAFGIHDADTWTFTLRNVAHIQSTFLAEDQHRYTVAMSYTKGVSCYFDVMDWSEEPSGERTTELVLSAAAPEFVDQSATIGNIDNLDGSWRNQLSCVQIYNLAFTPSQCLSLHNRYCGVLQQYYAQS